jgi:hypothetical protein
VSALSLTGGTLRTILQVVTGSSKSARLIELGISFDGTSGAAVPVTVDLLRQTTAGTSASLSLVQENPQSEGPIATALQTFSSTEPTAGDVLRSWFVTPASGLFVMQFPLGREPVIGVSGRLGLRANPPLTVNCLAYMVFEE